MSNSWSENVRRARAERGMRQRDVANAAGISIAAVCLVERGYESTPHTRGRIAAALDRRPSELFPDKEEAGIAPGPENDNPGQHTREELAYATNDCT